MGMKVRVEEELKKEQGSEAEAEGIHNATALRHAGSFVADGDPGLIEP
jgi:hypothetical protein